MTTVWPIIVLGFVATTLLLLPVLLKGTWVSGSDSAERREQIPTRVEPREADKYIGIPLHLSYLLVSALLPLTVSLLLLWGAAARELVDNGWWIALVIILPAAVGALTAWNQQRCGDDGDSGD